MDNWSNSTCQCCIDWIFCYHHFKLRRKANKRCCLLLYRVWTTSFEKKVRDLSFSLDEAAWAWWNSCLSKFAVSTLASSKREWLPQCRTLHIPPWSCWTQKKHRTSVGHQFSIGALSGKRGLVLWEINKVTFLWMSELTALYLSCLVGTWLLISLCFLGSK